MNIVRCLTDRPGFAPPPMAMARTAGLRAAGFGLAGLGIAALLAITLALVSSAAFAADGAGKDGNEAAQERFDQPIVLKDHAIVSGNHVLLGDVFTNVGDLAGEPLTYAPEPGREIVLDARWLYRVAKHFNLPWRPFSMQDRVVVERDSVVVQPQELEDRIYAALVERGVDKDMSVSLSNRTTRLYLPADASPDIVVEDLMYDERTQRFAATILAPRDHPAAQRHRITGQLHRMVEVPVLTRRLRPNETIRKRDVTWVRVRADQLSRGTVLDSQSLVGHVARRGIDAEEPIRATQVQMPVLVKRGSIVTIELKQPFMTLTAQGRAVEDGSKGDVIRITNLQSRNLVEAEVVGAGRAVVLPAGAPAVAMN